MTDPRPTNDLDELASAYLDGEATPTERAQVEADPEAMETVALYRDQTERFTAPFPEPSAATQKAAIAAALDVFIARTPVTLSADPPPSDQPVATRDSQAVSSEQQVTTEQKIIAEPDYAVEATSIAGLTEAVDLPDQADVSPTSVSTTAAPNDTSQPHRPVSSGGDGGRGRRRWYQKISPAAAAVAALVVIIGGVGIFSVSQRNDDRLTSTAISGSAYAEDALDRNSADSAEDASLEELPEIGSSDTLSRSEELTVNRQSSDDAMSDDAMSEEAVSDEAMADSAMSDSTMADDAASDDAISGDVTVENKSAGRADTDASEPSTGSSAAADRDEGEDTDASADQDGFGPGFAEDDVEGAQGDASGFEPATRPGQSDDADFAFAESDSISPFDSGSGSGGSDDDTGGSGGSTGGGNDGSTGGGSNSSTGGGSAGNGGDDDADTGAVALNLRTDYLGTFSTISQLMSEATDRSPKPDPRDLPEPICDDVKDDLNKYSPTKVIGTGRIGGKDYVVYLISKPDRYDTAAATALDTCFLEIGQPYTS